MREPKDRLARLESYQNLPLPLRRAVRLHLIHGLPVAEAMRLSGRDRNVKRDWNRPAVQTVLAEYGNPDAFEDWVSRLAELEAIMAPTPSSPPVPEKVLETAPTTVQDAPPTAAPPVPPEYLPEPPVTAHRANQGEVILGGELPANARDLFPDLNSETAHFWRELADAEEDERRKLTALLSSREPTF